jgi:nucleotidyltransferase substrate binding protein (TIGR01987 family)
MERLKIRFDVFLKALKTLKKPIKTIKDIGKDDYIYDMIRDSIIKRFEFTYETFWQLLKELLEEEFKIFVVGPGNIFRESVRMKLIDEQELQICLEMGRDRNQTSHTYKEAVAEAIAKDIVQYSKTMSAIAKRLENTIPKIK